jgi:hypothetical protein
VCEPAARPHEPARACAGEHGRGTRMHEPVLVLVLVLGSSRLVCKRDPATLLRAYADILGYTEEGLQAWDQDAVWSERGCGVCLSIYSCSVKL